MATKIQAINKRITAAKRALAKGEKGANSRLTKAISDLAKAKYEAGKKTCKSK